MVQYKWIALSNTTLGIMMAMINGTIILISLPAIFRGIDINPLDSFQYLLWILFGYSIVTATLLVTFGRSSEILKNGGHCFHVKRVLRTAYYLRCVPLEAPPVHAYPHRRGASGRTRGIGRPLKKFLSALFYVLGPVFKYDLCIDRQIVFWLALLYVYESLSLKGGCDTIELRLAQVHAFILPGDDKELQQTIATMFKKNPKFVSEFILGVLQRESEEGKEELKVEWTPGYR
jgi:hypothetical protein